MVGQRERVCGVCGDKSGAQMSSSEAIWTELGELLRSSGPRIFFLTSLVLRIMSHLLKIQKFRSLPWRFYFSISEVGSKKPYF